MARFHLPIKVKFRDLKALGVVSSRADLHDKIKAGKLRRPNKNGSAMQSGAWWWGEDIAADLERERASTSSAESSVGN